MRSWTGKYSKKVSQPVLQTLTQESVENYVYFSKQSTRQLSLSAKPAALRALVVRLDNWYCRRVCIFLKCLHPGWF